MRDSNRSAAEDRRSAAVEAVDFEAGYAFDGTALRQTRIHKISPSSLRILTHERLTLRRMISVEVTVNVDQRVCLLAQITRLVGNQGTLFDYELDVLGHNTFLNALRSLAAKKNAVERRPATRVEVDFEGTCVVNGTSHKIRVHQISASGFRIMISQELTPRSLITVDIAFNLNQRVRVMGQVVRLAGRTESQFDYGLKVVGDNTMKNPLRAVVLHLNLKGGSKAKTGP